MNGRKKMGEILLRNRESGPVPIFNLQATNLEPGWPGGRRGGRRKPSSFSIEFEPDQSSN